jgi:hypothetical protein
MAHSSINLLAILVAPEGTMKQVESELARQSGKIVGYCKKNRYGSLKSHVVLTSDSFLDDFERKWHDLVIELELKSADIAIFSSFQKVSKDLNIIKFIILSLEEKNIASISVEEDFDSSTEQGRSIVSFLNRFRYPGQKNDVLMPLQQKSENLFNDRGGRLPFGYIRSSSGVLIEPHAAKIVQQIFKKRSEHKSFQQIADSLKGITPYQNKNWYPSTVKSIVNQEMAYRGLPYGKDNRVYPKILQDDIEETTEGVD